MNTPINQFYVNLLKAMFYETDKEGNISQTSPNGEEVRPAMIGDKRLVIPTREYLKSGETKHHQAFHPLSENIARGQSPVLRELGTTAKINVFFYLTTLATSFIQIAGDEDSQSSLPAAWNDFLKRTKDADEKSVDNFRKMLRAGFKNKKNGILSLFLKHGGRVKDKRYLRTCIVDFGIVDEIKTKKPYGVPIRNKDVTVFLEVLKTILPDIEEKDAYSSGSDKSYAPYFHALLESYVKIAADINQALYLLASAVDELPQINLSFQEMLDDVPSFVNQIPKLTGNEGDLVTGKEGEDDIQQPVNETTAGVATPAPVTQAPVQQSVNQPQQPVQQPVQQVNQQVQSAPGGWREQLKIPNRTSAMARHTGGVTNQTPPWPMTNQQPQSGLGRWMGGGQQQPVQQPVQQVGQQVNNLPRNGGVGSFD